MDNNTSPKCTPLRLSIIKDIASRCKSYDDDDQSRHNIHRSKSKNIPDITRNDTYNGSKNRNRHSHHSHSQHYNKSHVDTINYVDPRYSKSKHISRNVINTTSKSQLDLQHISMKLQDLVFKEKLNASLPKPHRTGPNQTSPKSSHHHTS